MDAKKNTLSQALMEMDEITKSIADGSKNTLKSMLSEAVRDVIRESISDDEDDDMEISDGEASTDDIPAEEPEDTGAEPQEGEPQGDAHEEPAAEDEPADDGHAEKEPETADGEGDDDEWSDLSQYNVGDDTYDLTGVKDYNEVVKVYKRLKDNDEVVVKSDGDRVQLADKQTGAEYVINLGDGEASKEDSGETNLNEENTDGADIDVPDATSDSTDDEIAGIPSVDEGKSCDKMKDKKETIFEIDLGYTDSYQKKDPIQGLTMAQPSGEDKNSKDAHAGIPTGTEKPWAGKSEDKGKPFGEEKLDECGSAMTGDVVDEGCNKTNEGCTCGKCSKCGADLKEDGTCPDCEADIEEGTNVTLPNSRKKSKSHTPDTEKKNYPQVHHHDSVAGEYKAMNESLKKENTLLKKELKALKEAVNALRTNLNEAYVTNVNLGKITKLFLENTTSRKEKIDIVNRFSNEAKTVNDSVKLYESINKTLKERKTTTITESKASKVEGSKVLNEAKDYAQKDLLETIDLMNRVMGC